MRCLIVGPKHNGIGHYIRPLQDGLIARGIDVSWIGTERLSFELEEVLWEAEQLRRRLDPDGYDIVHFQLGMYDLEQALLTEVLPRRKASWVLTAHGVSPHLFRKLGNEALNASVNFNIHRQFDRYLFFGEHALRAFGPFEGLGERVFFPSTHQNVQLSSKKAAEINNQYDLKKPFLALVGYPSPWKDCETLIEALRLLEQKVNLVLAGPWWTETLQPFLSTFPTNVNLQIIDRDLDAYDFLFFIRNAYVGILPYRDHFTMQGNGVVSNYLWEGKAIVATDALCLPEYIGDAGIVVKQGDPSALAYAIASLLSDSALHHHYEKRALERARVLLPWARHIDLHVNLYEHILTR